MNFALRCRFAAFGLLLSSLAGAAAWDDTGHLLTMRIAFDRLTPTKQAKLREELAGLRIDDRDFSNPTVAATYMDGLRAKTRRYPTHPRGAFEGMFRDWHFVVLDYTAEGGPLPSGPPDAEGHADVIRGWHRARELYLARQTQPFPYAGETWPIGPREALALLLHMTGDAHQPLHTTSHPLPNGEDDSGGNGVEVDNGTSLNLHAFWDSAYRRTTHVGRGDELRVGEDPARKATRDAGVEDAALGEIARAIIAAAGLSEEQIAAAARQLDPADWVRESHARGFADGYQALGAERGREKVNLTPAYVENAKKVAAIRLALAGVRLAAVLDGLLGAPPPDAEKPVRFAVLGDFDGRWAQTRAVAKMIVDWKPDFILTVGDNTYRSKTGDTKIYQDVVALFPDFIRTPGHAEAEQTRFFPVLGSHDYESRGSGYHAPRIAEYAATFALPQSGDGLHYYEVVRAPVHCFALDSNQVRTRHRTTGKLQTIYDQTGLGSAQEKWFRERLAASTAPWKIAYFHHPPHHSSTRHGAGSVAMRAWDWPAAGLTAVFAGHVHGYERMVQERTGIFVTGLGGAPFYAFYSAAAQHAPGSKKRFPHPLPPREKWPRKCGALFVEATAQKLTCEFRTVGSATPIDRWSVTAR